MERKARASCLSLTPVKCIVYPWAKSELHQLLFFSPAPLSSYIPNQLIVKRRKPIEHFQIWLSSSPTVWKNGTRYPPRLVLIEGILRKFSLLISFFFLLGFPQNRQQRRVEEYNVKLCIFDNDHFPARKEVGQVRGRKSGPTWGREAKKRRLEISHLKPKQGQQEKWV